MLRCNDHHYNRNIYSNADITTYSTRASFSPITKSRTHGTDRCFHDTHSPSSSSPFVRSGSGRRTGGMAVAPPALA